MRKKQMLIGVLGLAVNNKGEFLLTQRNQPEDPEVHGKWQIPGGGMEFGESPEQTLSREMQEELTVSVRILYPHPLTFTSIWDTKSEYSHILILTYIVSLDDQKPIIGDPETLAFKWCSLEEAHKLETLPSTFPNLEAAKHILDQLSSNTK